MFDAPAVGFHFSVVFELPQIPADMRYQEVSGLTSSAEFETLAEGGENRFQHQLPVRLSHSDITLKRAAPLGSPVAHWARQALEKFEFKPANVMISLLNEQHIPLRNWYVVGATPKRFDISGFNAMQSELVTETLVLTCQYVTYTDPLSLALDAAGAAAGAISGSVSL